MIGFASTLLALAILPYAILVAMPSWRWFVPCALLLGGPLAWLWIEHWHAAQLPGYKEGPGGFIGIAIAQAFTFGVVVGIAVRALSLTLRGIGWPPGRCFAVNVCGILLAFGAFGAIEGWEAWKRRPPSEACRNASFDIALADLRLRLPAAAPIFNVYTGRYSAKGAYYFNLGPSLRDFCALTATGAQPVKATHLRIAFSPRGPWPGLNCDNARPAERDACAIVRAGAAAADLPRQADIYVPDEVQLGEFGGTHSTYDDAQKARLGYRDSFVEAQTRTADGKPLTFVCHESGDALACQTGHPWRNGVHVSYAFRAEKDAVAATGERTERAVQLFLGQFLR
jgi:hypothetical protein